MSCIRFQNVLDSRSLGPEPEAWLFLRHIGQAMNILAFAGVSEKVKVVFLLMGRLGDHLHAVVHRFLLSDSAW